MDRPAKRQKLSREIIADEALQRRDTRPHRRPVVLSRRPTQPLSPSRTLAHDRPLRPALTGDGPSELRRRSAGYVVLPRRPDVTVTAAAVEVVVNNGQLTSLVAAPTSDMPVALGILGTLTVSAVSTASTIASSSVRASALLSDSSSRSIQPTLSSTVATTVLPSSPSNGTITVGSGSSAQKTATVTAISTLHVSYNGTFILPTTQPASTSSYHLKTVTSYGSVFVTTDSSDSATPTYTFGESVTLTDASETATSTLSGAVGSSASTGAGIGTGAGSAATSSPSPTSNTNSGLPPLTPQQSQMVGGIVGGFAGIALVLVLILFFLRWYRARLRGKGHLPNQLGVSHTLSRFGGDTSLLRSSDSIAQTSKSSFAPASWVARWRPSPNMSDVNLTTNEKGFQRLSGRKIPSVFTHGGDGYDGVAINPIVGAYTRPSHSSQSPPHNYVYNTSSSTFYRDSDGSINYPHQPPSQAEHVAPYLAPSLDSATGQIQRPSQSARADDNRNTSTHDFATSRDLLVACPRPFSPQVARHMEGYAMMRDSPARTPVTLSPNASSVRLPIRAPLAMDADVPNMPLSPIGLGLGHDLCANGASSRISSRSGMSAGGRFKEDI